MPSRVKESPETEAFDLFEKLVEDLKAVLGPSSGIDSEDVNPAELQRLMELYQSEESSWSNYAWKDPSRGYTRNLVDGGNGKSNLLILVWTPGKGSPVHDHANAHCVMKILRGSLKETLYDWPEGEGSPMRTKKETLFEENEVTYMSDKLGLHKISNPDPEEFAVSLHLYTPPNAAKFGCYTFDETNGASIHVGQCKFFSEFGRRV